MIQFHYQTYGEKEHFPILFLHGFMGVSDDWQSVVAALQTDYHCLVLDLPGHGQTDVSESEDYRMEKTAEAIIYLLDSFMIPKCHLCSYSMGGRIAFYLAIHYPDRFDKMIIESGTPGLKTEAEQSERRLRDSFLSKRLRIEPFDQFLNDWYEMPFFQSFDKSSETFKSMVQRRLQNDPKKLSLSLRYIGTGSQPSLWMKLDSIESDMLLITGSLDDKYCRIGHDILTLQPKIRHTVIDGAGHNVHVEKEKEFINEIRGFLNR